MGSAGFRLGTKGTTIDWPRRLSDEAVIDDNQDGFGHLQRS